jgi:hypothetical protein
MTSWCLYLAECFLNFDILKRCQISSILICNPAEALVNRGLYPHKSLRLVVKGGGIDAASDSGKKTFIHLFEPNQKLCESAYLQVSAQSELFFQQLFNSLWLRIVDAKVIFFCYRYKKQQVKAVIFSYFMLT